MAVTKLLLINITHMINAAVRNSFFVFSIRPRSSCWTFFSSRWSERVE